MTLFLPLPSCEVSFEISEGQHQRRHRSLRYTFLESSRSQAPGIEPNEEPFFTPEIFLPQSMVSLLNPLLFRFSRSNIQGGIVVVLCVLFLPLLHARRHFHAKERFGHAHRLSRRHVWTSCLHKVCLVQPAFNIEGSAQPFNEKGER